jgi:hypothetical protein
MLRARNPRGPPSVHLFMTSRPFSARRAPLALMAGVVIAVAACEDPFRPLATLPTLIDSTTVFALNGTPGTAPSALALFDGAAVRVDARFLFDIAFDIDASGKVAVIPVRRLTTIGGGHLVGLQNVTTAYADLLEAPRDNYRHDTTFVVAPGAVLAVEVADPLLCSTFAFSPFYYAKIRIASVDVAARQIRVDFTVDRNCGFRSLVEGVPEF